MRIARLAGAILAATAALAITAGAASAETIYNKIQKPFPGNVVSQAFEATSTSEFGGEVEFAGVARKNPTVTVVMSSWACQNLMSGAACSTTPGATFAWPITLNIYEVGPERAPGALLATTTPTFNIPYRPSAGKKCTPNGEGVVGYGKECFHGKAFKISFPVEGVTLPPRVILSIAYNTTDYGYAPTHEADVGEDSLNVGYYEPGEPVTPVGSAPFPNDGYLNSTWTGAYCDNGAGGTGTFRLDSGCYNGLQPAFLVKATK
jgi:hypothetical protein